ncbi:MAG: LPS export ABC transporter ATP-binding protein [Planctomycetes bacterium]|nr:LPS export ABC transporter ATP-binding protein [Planctomycetota bacterium]MCC7170961.1 LPS export ABC transporter ATP-binding protein [Planctomycetota bacterium]
MTQPDVRLRDTAATKPRTAQPRTTQAAPKPLLVVRGLVKIYGKRTVVDGVSFHVNPSEIVGLLGPNGAGKTTSFHMTVGLITPEQGKVEFDGVDITRHAMFKRARLGIGYLSQERSVFRQMTVEENILAVLEVRGYARAQRAEITQALLDELGIAFLAKNRADTLSGGESRRLEIARTLATDPRLILLDEPFSGVDPKAKEEISEILVALKKRGIGILLTDHDVHSTLSTTDRSYIISAGKILREGLPRDLVNDEEVRRVYLGQRFRYDDTRGESSAPTAD